MDQERLDEIRAMRWHPDKYPAHALVFELLAHIKEQRAKIEQLREAAKIAAQICRLQRKNWYAETGDDKAYESWTKQIECFEVLARC